ncbi:MAG: hypothetical protein P4L68_10435 [Methylovirgula sp.]|nr:hypothetical protein [Methylovirgula sp.]
MTNFNALFPVVAAFLAAGLTWLGSLFLEKRREAKAANALALILHAELTRIRRKLVDHNRLLASYAAKYSNLISALITQIENALPPLAHISNKPTPYDKFFPFKIRITRR